MSWKWKVSEDGGFAHELSFWVFTFTKSKQCPRELPSFSSFPWLVPVAEIEVFKNILVLVVFCFLSGFGGLLFSFCLFLFFLGILECKNRLVLWRYMFEPLCSQCLAENPGSSKATVIWQLEKEETCLC